MLPAALLLVWLLAACLASPAAPSTPPDVDDVEVGEETIDGTAITIVHSPSASPRLGTVYLYASGATLFVVQALERDVAVEALGSLP